MSEIHLINQVLDWERRLEIENEKRKNYRDEPDYFPAAPQSGPKDHLSFFARLLKFGRERRPAYQDCPQEPCCETQPG